MSSNLLGMTGREFGVFCSVLQLDTAEKMRAVEAAASVARQYLAPFVIKAGVDMLDNLYAMVAANSWARVIYLGGDGYSFGDVIEQLDPLFHNRYCAYLHLSRITADAALEAAAQWSPPGVDGFRKPGDHRGASPTIWSDLVAYAEDSNLYLDRAGAEFALVDTGFKGSVQEMLTAAYPNATFHGHYLFFCATDDDLHPERKRGYVLHLDQPNALNGRAIRDRFVDDEALTFAHHDAIVAVEDLLRGPDVSPRLLTATPLTALEVDDRSRAGINPVLIAPRYADPYVRQAVLAAISYVVAVTARDLQHARATDPGGWYQDLTQRAAALRPELHRWLAGRPGDPELTQLLDSFVRRADKDRWTSRRAVSTPAARARSTTVTPSTPLPTSTPTAAPPPASLGPRMRRTPKKP